MLLGRRAVHPLEGCVLDEDRQCSEDEGRKQVQVDVVPGAVQVSVGESRALAWQDGHQFCSTIPNSQANTHFRHVSGSGTVLLSSFL